MQNKNYYIENGIVYCAKCNEELDYNSQNDMLFCPVHDNIIQASDIVIAYCDDCMRYIYSSDDLHMVQNVDGEYSDYCTRCYNNLNTRTLITEFILNDCIDGYYDMIDCKHNDETIDECKHRAYTELNKMSFNELLEVYYNCIEL